MNIRRIGLGLLVSAVCLYFVLRGVQWGEVWRHLSEVNIPLFLLSMLLMLFAYFLMTWRWQHLLDPLEMPGPSVVGVADGATPTRRVGAAGTPGASGVRQHESLLSLYEKMMTGYFFNAFFPARAGDIVRAYLLGRTTGLRKTTVLATIVIEKAFDGIALLIFFLLSLVLLPTGSSGGSAVSSSVSADLLAWVSAAALFAVIAGLLLFYRYSAKIARMVEWLFDRLPLPRRFERLAVRLIETFAGGMHVFKTPRPLFYAAGISLLVWIAVVFMFLTALLSFRTPFPPDMLSVGGLLFTTGLVNLGLLVPALPGNVGTYEALVVAAMAVFRVDKDLAVAFALVFHVGQLVVTLLVGLVAFWAQNLSLADMGKVEQRAGQESAAVLEEAPSAGER